MIEHFKCVDHSLWADPTTGNPWLTNGQFNAEMVEMLTHLLGCVVEHVWTRHWWGRQVWHCPWFILLFYLAEEELLSWAITIGLLNESLPLASMDLWLGVCWCYDMSHERMWVCEIDRPNSLQFRTLLRTLLLKGLPPLPTQLFDWLLDSQRCHPMSDCRPPPTQIGIWHQHIWHQRIWHLQLSIKFFRCHLGLVCSECVLLPLLFSLVLALLAVAFLGVCHGANRLDVSQVVVVEGNTTGALSHVLKFLLLEV